MKTSLKAVPSNCNKVVLELSFRALLDQVELGLLLSTVEAIESTLLTRALEFEGWNSIEDASVDDHEDIIFSDGNEAGLALEDLIKAKSFLNSTYNLVHDVFTRETEN